MMKKSWTPMISSVVMELLLRESVRGIDKDDRYKIAPVVRDMREPLSVFCAEIGHRGALTPTGMEKTVTGWIREHRKSCHVCEQKKDSTPA